MAPEISLEDEQIYVPDTLPILYLTNTVSFPMSVAPIKITSERGIRLLDEVVKGENLLGMVARKVTEDEGENGESTEEKFTVGCVGRVLQMQHAPDGTRNAVIQGLRRFVIEKIEREEPFPAARITIVEPDKSTDEELPIVAQTIRQQMAQLVELSPNLPAGVNSLLGTIDDPAFLGDLVASNLNVTVDELQELLANFDTKARLHRLTEILAREIEFLQASTKIQQEVKDAVDKGQREFYLRQQLKAIQAELGEGEGARPEIAVYREKIDALGLNEEVEKEVQRQLDRLESMSETSAEYHVIASYLDWIVDLPWNVSTEDRLDIARAEAILNEDHYGLEKVKRRILEYLAVRRLKPEAGGPILCFVGPPGVGKTSLGMSIARALNRKSTRLALGGVRDEAEIRGHRTTYVGAQPGRIIQNIRKAGSNNPVFILDEIDKVGSDFRGDPSSALLEVLDPAQNDTFTDHYLNLPFDLSKVMFIATANVLDTIPWALRDRMEIIELPGYTDEEKLHIARKYLLPRQREAHGIAKKKLTLTVAALRLIINAYTREAGVRNLEREIANVCRGCAYKIAGGRRAAIKVDADDLPEYLGHPKFQADTAERTLVPGVATGMAYTPVGGDILFIEATGMPGKGGMQLTGHLGDVMKESAQAALSFVRANADALGIAPEYFAEHDIHIHVPSGAVPKDGPSAGVTILTALTSLALGKPVKNGLAMTGEITLRGLVLPVGGIKEKVLAAVHAGVKDIILPERCRNDIDDIPESARKKVRFHFVSRMNEVLRIALGVNIE